MKQLTTLILVFVLSAALLVGCAITPQNTATHQHSHEGHSIEILPELTRLSAINQAAGGVLRLKINPEIALHYDENGKVTKLEGHNPEGIRLVQNLNGYEGKDTSQVLEDLVLAIGQAGYFVEEAEGKARKIVLELDPGSQVPHEKFLEDMAAHVKACVESKTWNGDREYDYQEPAPQETTAPAATEPAVPAETEPAAPAATTPASKGNATKETAPAKKTTTSSAVPAGLCPVCADDDCDDGKYCDDADEKAENLREYKAKKKAASAKKTTTKKVTKCSVCGDTDCDDGKYCDDWDDRYDDDNDDDDDDD